MKEYLIVVLIAIATSQITVTPKTQACLCTNLLNQADCVALSGCQWTPANTTMTNTTNATNTSVAGICANSTNTTTVISVPPTFCGSVANATACAGILGCAYLNSTCQIFTGCSAYVQTTNAACQAISTQCTTDGTRCVLPGACSTYTTQALCTGNLATSGARQCKWTAGTGTTGTCGDMICTDAPATYSTLALCQGWISTCFSTGKGCVASLGLCSSYTIAAGCTGMIGSDGFCTASSGNGATACRYQQILKKQQKQQNRILFLDSHIYIIFIFDNKMKELIVLLMLIPLIFSQTSVTPWTQRCVCTNLMTQADCQALSGCMWNFNDISNSLFNTTTSTGKCINQNKSTQIISTLCRLFADNSKLCASTIGCAYLNGICQIFAGCSAYVGQTNSQCQEITFQCTTDGTRCVLPGACSTYTTVTACKENISNSGAKKCKWVIKVPSVYCDDMTCTDAPSTYNTTALCQGWINQCTTNGKGCVSYSQLGQCYSYAKSQCTGMIGSDGICIVPTAGTIQCRPLECQDAPTTIASNTQCNAFLKGCITNGIGCVSSLYNCDIYLQTVGCTKLIANDGPCTPSTTKGYNNCRAITCLEAPSGTSTDAACNTFLKGCQTTGQGCISQRPSCSVYLGTSTTCGAYIGIEGNCKGVGSTVAACSAKLCIEAATTLNTNDACSTYRTGCVTTGAGCVLQLGLCSTYYGTATTCTQYRGLDGNCTAPTTQTDVDVCVAKNCSDGVFTTNSACQAFSYQCVTNGINCIVPGECENIGIALTCQGVSTCYYGSQCLDKSNCSNFTTQSQCLFNQQQHVPSGSINIYLRGCIWGTTCDNQLCTDLSATLTTDESCENALSGCLTTGAGCVDISAGCLAYQGTNLTCLNFRGLNGTKLCTQLQIQTSAAACIYRQCDNAHIANGNKSVYSSTSECQQYLSSCYWNGSKGCTSGGCNTYFGLQQTCSEITTAGSPCWSMIITGTNVACINKACSYAAATLNTNAQCETFLKGCVTNGAGCVSNETNCSQYNGNLAQCQNFREQIDHQCSKIAAFCGFKECTDFVQNPSQTVCVEYLASCFFDGTRCAVKPKAAACNTYQYNSAAQCNSLFNDAIPAAACVFLKGASTCSERTCGDEIDNPSRQNCSSYLSTCYYDGTGCAERPPAGPCSSYTSITSAIACNNLYDNDVFPQPCGFAAGTTECKARECTDVIGNEFKQCQVYLSSCYNETGCAVVPPLGLCSTYKSSSAKGCNQLVNSIYNDGALCGYAIGGTSCKDRECTDLIVNPSQSVCTQYLSRCYFDGLSCAEKPASGACSSYLSKLGTACISLVNNGSPAVGCSYEAGSNNCKDRSCIDMISDPTQLVCSSYLSTCFFNGMGCAEKPALGACSSYLLTSPISCNNLVNESSQGCGYATEGTTCKDRECSDIIVNPSQAVCDSYLSSCSFNGTRCYTEVDCTSYVVKGTTNQQKAIFCNLLQDQSDAKCTYIFGNNCANALEDCQDYSINNVDQCSVIQTLSGNICGFTVGQSKCSARTCAQVNESACSDSWMIGCVIKTTTPCATKACNLAANTIATDSVCAKYRQGCVTNGSGCVESSALCSAYQGTKDTCQKFTGGTDGLCNNVDEATAYTTCIAKTCAANITATNNKACIQWKANCVWTGSVGCKDQYSCADFTGTIDTCPKFIGTDGPCSGIEATLQQCVSNSTICDQAPYSFTTNSQCQSWHKNCITNGFGCINQTGATCNMIVSPTACTLYRPQVGASSLGLRCDIASECLRRPSSCKEFISAFQCSNVPISGENKVTCGWSKQSNSCVSLTCDLLPASVQTDSACSGAMKTCTTNGAGCVTKGACSTYNKLACGNAATTDTQKLCVWADSLCRPIQCSDNITATTDEACNLYLTGCKTIGIGCSNLLTCSYIRSDAECIKDQLNNPCIWYKGKCKQYKECSDISETTHYDCQLVSPYCTTNGITCIAITGCSLTKLQISCFKGTDGQCGWLPATDTTKAKCTLFEACYQAKGSTLEQCQLWGSNCLSDGLYCIERTKCSLYITQIGCRNAGTDGICFFDQKAGICRLQQCSDATNVTALSITTHAGCAAFLPDCTTSGIGCIDYSTCGSYVLKDNCVKGTDGDCYWSTTTKPTPGQEPATTSSFCVVKQCTDIQLNSSSLCAFALKKTKCVSNGVNCIPQSNCNSYSEKEACNGGGTDGKCIFIQQSNSSTGICEIFKSCNQASFDVFTCQSRSDACFFNSSTDGVTSLACLPHTCETKAVGSNCQPFPSFDLATYQICVFIGTTCVEGNPSQLTSFQCFENSVRTHMWDPKTNLCQACQTINTEVTNTNIGFLINIILKVVFML